MASFFIKVSSTHGKWVYGILAVLTLIAAWQIRLIQIDTDPENMLPEEHPQRVIHNEVKQTFSMYDAIVVGVVATQSHDNAGRGNAGRENGVIYSPELLKNIHALTEYILQLDGVVTQDVMALSTVDNIRQGSDGALNFSWLMPTAPKDTVQALEVKHAVERLPMLYNTLVSETGKAAAIYVPIVDKNQSYAIGQAIRQFIAKLPETQSVNGDWHITGLPIAEDQFGKEMFVQMGIAAPAAGLMIFLLLFVFFRNIPLIVAPMVVAMATVIITMGSLIGMGFTVHIMSSMIAIFLMPIAVVDAVHILSEFSDRYKPGESAASVIQTVVGHLYKPMLFTSLTSSAGFFSLMLTPIPPVQIFGAYIGMGILLAFIVTLTFIPAYISRMSPKALAKLQQAMHTPHSQNRTLLQKMTEALRVIALRYKGGLLVVFALVCGVSVWGISQIQINDNPVRWFKADHEIRVADTALNKEFAGTYNAYIVLKNSANAIDAKALLNQSPLPDELAAWSKGALSELAVAHSDNKLTVLAMAIDDALFEGYSDAAIAVLEDLAEKVDAARVQGNVFQQPEYLAVVSQLQAFLTEHPLVGKSQSLADIVKVVNRELLSGDPLDYRLPHSQQAVAQHILQYQSSHRPQDLWHFVTPDYQQTLIWLQLTSGDNQDMTQVINAVNGYFEDNPLPEGITHQWAGKAYLNVVWQDNMVAGMLDSLLSAFLIVFVMMVLLFRSFVFGILAMLPLTITITFIYGAIGLVGKDYDMPIAVLSALTLGLSVDFAIHFLARAREIYRQTGDVNFTLNAMFDEPASAISRNALVIALGFTPLLLAPLVPYITVGVFLASIMAISALVTLLVLPAAMFLLKPWVFPKE